LINKSNFYYDELNTTESFDKIFNEKVSVDEVLLIINNLKDKTAAGHDGISVNTLKLIAQNISVPLTHIYNLSISESTFPDIFKLAIIKPLYKNGDRASISNYRPISMISNFAKILEKVIKSRLIQFLEKNNILSKNQFGPGQN